MTPGRKFSTTTSEAATSRRNTSWPLALFRLTVLDLTNVLVGAELGELIAAERAGEHIGQIQHPGAGEKPTHY